MISERISDDILPQMTNLNMVIPILMYFFNIYTSEPGICLKRLAVERRIFTTLTNHKRRKS